MNTYLLKGINEISDKAIVMGDPDRVLLLEKLLEDPEIVFDKRGYIVVNGHYNDKLLTLASHGIGCASASIIFEELRILGAKTMVRLGTAGSLRENLVEGDILLAAGAGYRYTGCCTNMYSPDINGAASPDPLLLAEIYNYLSKKNKKPLIGTVFTSDALHAEEELVDRLVKRGFSAIDMETAILYMLGWMRNYRSLSVLIISNNLVRKTPIKSTRELSDIIIETAEALMEYLTRTDESSEPETVITAQNI